MAQKSYRAERRERMDPPLNVGNLLKAAEASRHSESEDKAEMESVNLGFISAADVNRLKERLELLELRRETLQARLQDMEFVDSMVAKDAFRNGSNRKCLSDDEISRKKTKLKRV